MLSRSLLSVTAIGHIARWLIGGLIGTCLIAVTSPWFIRSYVPLRVDPVRGTWTLPPGTDYRWRSEGYATTDIGPLGMPGKTSLSAGPAVAAASPRRPIRVALWGDSQAEGVCVPDSEKLFAQAERIAGDHRPLAVYPLARSGEDAAVWLTQMPAVERALEIDVHVMLIVDLPDLVTADQAPLAPTTDRGGGFRAALAAHLPAFILQAARHMLTEADGITPRTLRFSLGPVEEDRSPRRPAEPDPEWSALSEAIVRNASRPVILLHAPPVPQIIGGRVRTEEPSDISSAQVRRAAEAHGITWVSARAALLESAAEGQWPHGFHNGRIGSGHLNAVGYRIVAEELVRAVKASAVGQAASLSTGVDDRLAACPTAARH